MCYSILCIDTNLWAFSCFHTISYFRKNSEVNSPGKFSEKFLSGDAAIVYEEKLRRKKLCGNKNSSHSTFFEHGTHCSRGKCVTTAPRRTQQKTTDITQILTVLRLYNKLFPFFGRLCHNHCDHSSSYPALRFCHNCCTNFSPYKKLLPQLW